MNVEQVRELCLQFPGVEESLPFDGETLVFKVCGAIFAVLPLEKPDTLILKCYPPLAQSLREHYASVEMAAYFARKSWNRLNMRGDVPADRLQKLISHAYAETLRSLPKKVQIPFLHSHLPSFIIPHHCNVCDTTMQEIRRLSFPADAPEDAMLLLTTDLQRAGRGQRGTHWEAQNGKNLLFSLRFRPRSIAPTQQFLLSEAASLALLRACEDFFVDDEAHRLTIKWPNDLYFDDQKLAGMLLEHELCGNHISETIVGIGLNVNQDLFRSDAPNPISLYHATGTEHPRYLILEHFLAHFLSLLSNLEKEVSSQSLHSTYFSHLYRRHGLHTYRRLTPNTALPETPETLSSTLDAFPELFEAEIAAILPDGRLQLRLPSGHLHAFAFKEIGFELKVES